MESKFTVGTEVAVVHSGVHGRRIDGKRRVAKVHASGRFTITRADGTASPQQYRPDSSGTSARQTGESGYCYRQWVEVWTERHDAELAALNELRAKTVRISRIKDAITQTRMTEFTNEQLAAIEAALGIGEG